jgi:RNA polymerase sigma-70 factor (ECF subfamily)
MDTNSLYDKARSGDRESREELFGRLSARFRLFAERRIGSTADAEQVVQDALLIVLKKYESVRIETSFAAWAHKVLEFEVLRYYKRTGTRERRFGEYLEQQQDSTQADPDPTLKARLLDCLAKVGKHNQRYARILNLHYQGYGTREICERLQVTENHSYVLLSRARNLLTTCLESGKTES